MRMTRCLEEARTFLKLAMSDMSCFWFLEAMLNLHRSLDRRDKFPTRLMNGLVDIPDIYIYIYLILIHHISQWWHNFTIFHNGGTISQFHNDTLSNSSVVIKVRRYDFAMFKFFWVVFMLLFFDLPAASQSVCFTWPFMFIRLLLGLTLKIL